MPHGYSAFPLKKIINASPLQRAAQVSKICQEEFYVLTLDQLDFGLMSQSNPAFTPADRGLR